VDTQKKKEENSKPLNEHNNTIIMNSILKKSNIKMIFHKNEGGKEPYFTYDKICYGEENKEINNQQFKEIEEYLENKENNTNINYKLFFDYLADIKKKIKEQFKYDYPLRFKIEFEKEDKDKDNDTDNIYSISSTMTFYPPFNGKVMRYKDNNILNYKTEAKEGGFKFMINDINREEYKNIEYQENIIEKKESLINNFNNLNDKKSKKIEDIEQLSTKSKTSSFNDAKINYAILDFSTATMNLHYERELREDISKGWNNNKFIKKTKYNYVQEKKIIESNNTSLKSFKNYNLDNNFVNNKISVKEDIENTSILCTDKNIFILKESGLIKSELTKIYNKSYIGGIKINKDLVALTSNSILSNGEDKLLLIYNLKVIPNSIKLDQYSFVLSQNNLCLINIPESFKINHENNKIILGACKRYTKGKKNGILLIILENTIAINKKFYDTKNFEVFCFCQIANVNLEILAKNQISYTKYILVGGYDSGRKKALIKLYQISFKKDIYDCEVIFIQDIIIKKKNIFKKFTMPITSITQSGLSGNILVTCSDGSAYLFNQPELGYLDLINDKKFD